MNLENGFEPLRRRRAAVELAPDDFRSIGHRLVDQLADFLGGLPSRPVTPGETPASVRAAIGSDRALPEQGAEPASVVADAANLLFSHSLLNGHPRFFGYITSSAMPIGAFGDFIAAVLNCNAGAWKLAPAATEIEAQTVRWIAEFIGYPVDCGGLLVSGGNMANFVGFVAARAAQAGAGIRTSGMRDAAKRLCCYCSTETHTWIQKAADLFGLGTDSIRWIPCDRRQRLDVSALRAQLEHDRGRGEQPFLVAGTAGSVSTGAVDPLPELAALCREQGLWFHVDGAYGGVAAKVPGAPADLRGLALADSVVVDPHKWLYAPLEAGCVLVRDPRHLLNAFSYHPPYYTFDADSLNYFDLGPQNSRAFRALKIWMAFQQAGRAGFSQTIADDISLAERAFTLFSEHPDFEAVTRNLSICTFRYVPRALRPGIGSEVTERLLNELNRELLRQVETGGETFLSNAVVDGRFLLRMCIVNFRTALDDIELLPRYLAESGARVFAAMDRQARAPV
jgi:glutamate/tyrosine decarboxylase-like PLP-dependent enzyme